MIEKRKHPRVATQESAVIVELRYAAEDAPEESRTIFCSTADLSLSGVRLTLDVTFAASTPLKITVIFRDPPCHFKHLGIVRWCERSSEAGRYEVGIEFLHPLSEESATWREFLQTTFPSVLSEPGLPEISPDQPAGT